MPRNSSATKARIVEAAFREFAAHGLAGARIDRIAANAEVNKRAIYDYFGDKDMLFDRTLLEVATRGTDEVPRLWNDLPEHAGHVYDYFAADPDLMRIHLWRQLERPQAREGEAEAYPQMIHEMGTARTAPSRWKPTDLFALVWALHFTWLLAPPGLHTPRARRMTVNNQSTARRAAIVEAVRHLTDG